MLSKFCFNSGANHRSWEPLSARFFLSIFSIAFLILPVPRPLLAQADDDLFEARIRPVLAETCFGCHGNQKSGGMLRVDSREALLTGGDSGPAIVPGQPDESLLVKALGKFAIIEWENVFKADGDAPAELNDANVEQLLDFWVIADEFLKRYVSQIALVKSEGNVSAPAANGTLETVPATVTSAS